MWGSDMAEVRKYVGFKPFPWQRDVINGICRDDAKGVHCVKSRRQCGKSAMIANVLLWFALNRQGSVSAAVSPTMAQARKLYRDIVEAVYESKVMRRYNETLLEIVFINGSRLFFRSAEMGDALRGYVCTGVICLDEAAYLNDSILPLVLPWGQVHHCPYLICSSPRMKAGFFYRYFAAGLSKQKWCTSYDWAKYDTSALLSEEQLEQYRQQLPKNQFRSEYLGEFLDTEGMVFTGFRECMGKASRGEAVCRDRFRSGRRK